MTNVTVETVWSVRVDGRMDGLYLFRNLAEAEMFNLAVEKAGGSAVVTEEPINHGHGVYDLIAAEGSE